MRTEIVIPFAFDTAPIESRLEDDAFDVVTKNIEADFRKNIEQKLPKHYGKIDWEAYIRMYLWRWLDEHAEEVVETASLLLAKKARDKRQWRKVLEEMKEE